MSKFFLELFSEEVPALLQRNSRILLLNSFQKLFEEKKINFKKSASYSTPNRLIITFEGLISLCTKPRLCNFFKTRIFGCHNL